MKPSQTLALIWVGELWYFTQSFRKKKKQFCPGVGRDGGLQILGQVSAQTHLSNEKNPGCFWYIRDYTTQLHRDYNKPWNKDS